MTESLTPSPTDRVVTLIVDDPHTRVAVQDLVLTIRGAPVLATHPSPHVRSLIDQDLLEQAILGAITRFVETAIDGQI